MKHISHIGILAWRGTEHVCLLPRRLDQKRSLEDGRCYYIPSRAIAEWRVEPLEFCFYFLLMYSFVVCFDLCGNLLFVVHDGKEGGGTSSCLFVWSCRVCVG